MKERTKRIFLGICIIIPFLLYCFYYYSGMLKNAPYRFADFESIVLLYGDGEELDNQFDTKTGRFQYVNSRDSIVVDTVRMRNDDLLHLHRKAAQLGFWNLPDDMTVPRENSEDGKDIARFSLQYNYKEKSKTVVVDADYEGIHPKMLQTAKTVIEEVQRVLNDARDR